MFCRKCGSEIDTRYTNPDGSIECPDCGAVYMLRSSRSSVSSRREPQTTRPRQTSNVHKSDPRPRSVAPLRRRPVKARVPKWFLGIVAVCVVSIGVSIITASSNPYAEQYKLIAKMEKALNDRNMTALLDCFEPTYSETMLEMVSMMGYDVEDILSGIIDVVTDDAYQSLSGYKVKITPTSCTVDGNKSTVHVKMSVTAPSGASNTGENNFDLIKVNGNWYLDVD